MALFYPFYPKRGRRKVQRPAACSVRVRLRISKHVSKFQELYRLLVIMATVLLCRRTRNVVMQVFTSVCVSASFNCTRQKSPLFSILDCTVNTLALSTLWPGCVLIQILDIYLRRFFSHRYRGAKCFLTCNTRSPCSGLTINVTVPAPIRTSFLCYFNFCHHSL